MNRSAIIGMAAANAIVSCLIVACCSKLGRRQEALYGIERIGHGLRSRHASTEEKAEQL
jgi:hypothetical protein